MQHVLFAAMSQFASCDVKYFKNHSRTQWFTEYGLSIHFYFLYGDTGPYALVKEEKGTKESLSAHKPSEVLDPFVEAWLCGMRHAHDEETKKKAVEFVLKQASEYEKEKGAEEKDASKEGDQGEKEAKEESGTEEKPTEPGGTKRKNPSDDPEAREKAQRIAEAVKRMDEEEKAAIAKQLRARKDRYAKIDAKLAQYIDATASLLPHNRKWCPVNEKWLYFYPH